MVKDNWEVEDIRMAKQVVSRFAIQKNSDLVFYDLCFCITAPVTNFDANIKVNQKLVDWDYFHKDIPEQELLKILRPTIYFNQKMKRLQDMKAAFPIILQAIRAHASAEKKREWLVRYVSGLGMKAASHFLRNFGETDLAIIDVHVLKYLKEKQIRSKKHYLALENKFRKKAQALGLTVAELDALVWKRFSGTKWEDFVR